MYNRSTIARNAPLSDIQCALIPAARTFVTTNFTLSDHKSVHHFLNEISIEEQSFIVMRTTNILYQVAASVEIAISIS